jgi:5'-nucleotidase / UDP-sugar diphosphatase
MRGRFGRSMLWGALVLGCGNAPASVEAPRASLTLLHTADVHSRVWPFRARISRFEAQLGLGQALTLAEVGGVARLATLLEAERRRAAALWLDSGDVLEGAPVFHRFGGRLELELFGALGLGAMALGNHELSLDGETLGNLLLTSGRFPMLAANLRPLADSALAGLVLPGVLLDAGGVRVGVVGVANADSPPNLNSSRNQWGLELAPDLAAAVQVAIDDIGPRAALLVVLSHLGLERDRELVRDTTGIDVVLGGHQHILTAEPEWQDDCSSWQLQQSRGCSPRRVPIVHSGAYSQWLSRLDLALTADPADASQLEVTALALAQLPVTATVPAEPRVAEYLEAQRPPPEPPLAFLPAPLSRRSALGGDSPLGNLTTDAMLAATEADVAVLNSSGLREDLEAGPLLRSDLDLAFPFDEPWRLAWLNGGVLRRGLERAAGRSAARSCEAALQVSGLELKVHCDACAARRTDCLEIARRGPLGKKRLAVDDWLLVVLPVYLTLAGADFEEVGSAGSAFIGSAVEFIVRHLQGLPRPGESAGCTQALSEWPLLRCREAFGASGCPLDADRARTVCRALPRVEGGRDGRIEMLP